MKESTTFIGNKIVTSIQISLLFFFYAFAAGVITFVSYGAYRSWVNNDAWVHALIIASLTTFVFLILIFVVTMVFGVIIKEGQKDEYLISLEEEGEAVGLKNMTLQFEGGKDANKRM